MQSVAAVFRASEMATPLSDAYALSPNMAATSAREFLLALRFDQAPVRSEDGRLLGWARTAQLGGRGVVESSLIALDRCVVLSREAPVGDAVRAAAEHGLVFLAGRTGISDFVVPSDLDRHVVRCHLYVILSEIELLLADQVREVVNEKNIVERFSPDQQQRYSEARQKGRETHAVEYLYLSDYVRLVDDLERLLTSLDRSARVLRRQLHMLNELRTCVAHPTKSVTGQFEPQEIAARTDLAEELLIELTRCLR